MMTDDLQALWNRLLGFARRRKVHHPFIDSEDIVAETFRSMLRNPAAMECDIRIWFRALLRKRIDLIRALRGRRGERRQCVPIPGGCQLGTNADDLTEVDLEDLIITFCRGSKAKRLIPFLLDCATTGTPMRVATLAREAGVSRQVVREQLEKLRDAVQAA